MKKRMLSLVLAVVLVAGLLPTQRAAAEGEPLETAIISTEGLTAQIAYAYLELLDRLEAIHGKYNEDWNGYGFYGGYLMDLSGDGVPELCATSSAGGPSRNCDIWTWDGFAPKQLVSDSEAYYGTYTATLSLHPRDGTYCYDNVGVTHNTSRVDGPTVEGGNSILFKGSEGVHPDSGHGEKLDAEHTAADDAFMLLSDFDWCFAPNSEEMRAQLETAVNIGIPYVGDFSRCKMPADQARAYAAALAGLPTQIEGKWNTGTLHAALIDVAGDGMPLLLTAYLVDSEEYYGSVESVQGDVTTEPSVWTYQNGTVTRCAWEKGMLSGPCNIEIGTWEGTPVISVDDGCPIEVGAYGGHLYYTVSNAQMTLAHTERNFSATCYDGVTISSYLLPEGKTYGNDPHMALVDEMAADGWKINRDDGFDSFYAYLSMLDGVVQNSDDNRYEEVLNIAFWGDVAFAHIALKSGSELAQLLTDYAKTVGMPSYTFPAVTDDEARVKAIAEAVAAELGGEITALYQMADGLWYVVITVDGTIKGAVVQAVKSGGKLTYEVLERHDEPAAEETLQNLANDFRSKPNLTPDYAATEGFTTAKEYEDYLKKLLDNIPGGAPNDAAKGELAAFLENSVSRVSTVTVPAKENRVTLTGSDISAGCASAKETGDALQGVLTGTDVSLNKALTIIIRVECQGLDSGKPLQLDLDASLLDTLGDAELMLLLGDGSHAVRLTAADLRALINAYGVLSIQMEKTGDAAYTINFLDAEGELINWLCANVSFFLPASGPLATVLASYQGGSDNWGGQYDERTAAIRFSTPYSGVYEVMENDLAISDLDGVSEEQRAAVAFMVSKGYFTLDGEGAFRPGVSLKRYDFTKALVGMFFALEHDLSTTFTDVPADSPYRDVVASAQAKNLIKGYNETTFAGEDNISGEQVLTLAGRTLVERKGYSYPADPAQYLTFPGGAEVDDWAQEATALAVREGVLTPGESLSPLTDLSRADAALYLYRLFMLLYEVSPETIQMQTPPEKPAAPAIPVVPIVLGAGGVALVGVGAWLWLKRKKTDA